MGTPDANYPAYEPYDTVNARMASIGEFGLDVSTGAIYDPAVAKDYMSYCNPQWTSLYHYRAQLLNAYFDPRYVASGDRPPWWDHYKIYRDYDIRRDLPYPQPERHYRVHDMAEPQLQPSIVVTGLLRDGELDVRSVLRVDAVSGGGDVGAERLEILDRRGRRDRSGSSCGTRPRWAAEVGAAAAAVVAGVVVAAEATHRAALELCGRWLPPPTRRLP